jgi:hypothetical protein
LAAFGGGQLPWLGLIRIDFWVDDGKEIVGVLLPDDLIGDGGGPLLQVVAGSR